MWLRIMKYKFRKAQQRFCHKAFNDDQCVSLNQGFTGPPGEFGKPVSAAIKTSIYGLIYA